MISNYLKELINHNNRIIIPDFGAIMIQDTSEGKQITFNDFLKFNDGLLVNQIIKSEKTSKNQATEKIKDFIKEVEKCFSANQPYELSGIGFLIKDSHGNIKFEKTSLKKPDIKPTDVKPTIVLDESATTPKAEEVAKAPEKNEDVAPKKAITPEPTTVPPIREAAKTEPVIPKMEPPKTSPSGSIPKNPHSKQIPSTKMKNNTLSTVIIAAVVLIILGGAIWAAWEFNLIDKFTDKFFKKEVVQTPVEPVAITDTLVVSDTLTETVAEPTIVEESETKIDPNARRYYIVAGSFKVASNADRFNKKLTSQGYMSEIVMRRNGFHVVSYKTVYDKQEAIMEWKKMREKNPETWIYIK